MRFSQVRLLVDDFGAAFGFYRHTPLHDASGNLIELFQVLPARE